MAHLLGIDVSTTGAKALLIDEGGRVVADANTEYPLSTLRPLWSEQSPADCQGLLFLPYLLGVFIIRQSISG